ncbi:MAG: nodulation protein, partial [Bdellovibrionales bacterium]|nr:nodulation protein [Bdellovibrionales bacterium]
SFRPFGCSVLWESASTYFEVPAGFNGPFMSFAVPVRKRFRTKLKEVVHVDGTCRIQTVRKQENILFHSMIQEFGKVSGFPGVLNTSLNVMGEPLVETLWDAKVFFDSTNVDCLVVGNSLIEKRPS